MESQILIGTSGIEDQLGFHIQCIGPPRHHQHDREAVERENKIQHDCIYQHVERFAPSCSAFVVVELQQVHEAVACPSRVGDRWCWCWCWFVRLQTSETQFS